ncbi:Rubrerythrin [Selenomonas sp. GACV-9]|uniref:rubredoxin-like domain-containing protein n=1 Tax=Selenomonas sp. GACV-9 TaxID=3158782 RepID=UPI0008E50AB0|nr:Rubrerythrin [Selenomonas ruminantium]
MRFKTAYCCEAVHAGFYATLNGQYPQDFWSLLRTVEKVETNGEAKVMEMAAKVRAAGFDEAADEMEVFAKQEGHHGVLVREIIAKYGPQEQAAPAGQKVYICPICGYEHVDDIADEADDYTCPLCGQPKAAFKAK